MDKPTWTFGQVGDLHAFLVAFEHFIGLQDFPELEVGSGENIGLFRIVNAGFGIALLRLLGFTINIDQLVGIEQELDLVPLVVVRIDFRFGLVH